MSAPSNKPLNETNYEEWALAAMAYLQNTRYWGYVEGIELPPLKPFRPIATGTDTKSTTTVPPYQPESNDPTYLSQFYRYYERYQQYTSNLVKASDRTRPPRGQHSTCGNRRKDAQAVKVRNREQDVQASSTGDNKRSGQEKGHASIINRKRHT